GRHQAPGRRDHRRLRAVPRRPRRRRGRRRRWRQPVRPGRRIRLRRRLRQRRRRRHPVLRRRALAAPKTDRSTSRKRTAPAGGARGYARNFLLPRGLAEVATPGIVKEIERRDAQRARHEAKTVDEAQAIAKRVEARELRFDVNAGPNGALFGSVTATNVADRLWEKEKIRVDRRKLEMDTIKRIGRYRVSFEVFTDVVAELKVVVAPEGHELPPEQELAELEARERAEADAAEGA